MAPANMATKGFEIEDDERVEPSLLVAHYLSAFDGFLDLR